LFLICRAESFFVANKNRSAGEQACPIFLKTS
jgi:hypothetical protein